MWALRAGAERAETQPKDLWLDDNKTPDIDIILGEIQILVDVAVVHPTAPSYVVEARNPLGGSPWSLPKKTSMLNLLLLLELK